MKLRELSFGFALVITLIMVVLAAIITITFLISASADRTTSSSYNYHYQAELAVQNGLEAAKRVLSTDGAGNPITQDDTFIVTRVAPPPIPLPTSEDTTPHYYYIGRAVAGNTNITYYPLFSASPAPIPQVVAITAATNQPTYPRRHQILLSMSTERRICQLCFPTRTRLQQLHRLRYSPELQLNGSMLSIQRRRHHPLQKCVIAIGSKI